MGIFSQEVRREFVARRIRQRPDSLQMARHEHSQADPADGRQDELAVFFRDGPRPGHDPARRVTLDSSEIPSSASWSTPPAAGTCFERALFRLDARVSQPPIRRSDRHVVDPQTNFGLDYASSASTR